ncbi:MAG: hypothetical protein ACI4HQ_01280 [Acetatifactor sp.]
MNMEYWKKFENTGKIEDYLNFVSCEMRKDAQPARTDRYLGEGLHAGSYHTDRDNIEAVSRGGI